MPANPESPQQTTQPGGAPERLLSHCLSLDLEVGAKDQRIHAFAALRPDSSAALVYPDRHRSLTAALAKLDDMAQGVDFILGHNIIAFDLPHLAAAQPDLKMLKSPAVDTLRLSPLAFPRNPYHHLVLQRRFKEGCAGRREGRRGAWHGSAWPVRYYPAYPRATATTQPARTVPGAAFPAPPGRPAAS